MKNTSLTSIVALVLSIVAIAMCTLCCMSKEKVVAKALEENPAIVVEALQKYEENLREEQFAAAQAVIKNNTDKLYNDASTPYTGPKEAKATLVLFYDYSCGYCHRLYPVITELAAKNPDVKVAYKPLTFLGPISDYAARAVLAANEQGKFVELNDALFTFDGNVSEEDIDSLAEKAGINVAKMKSDMTSDKVNKILEDMYNLASTVQVAGVPTMILGDKVLQTFDTAEIQQAIDAIK